MTYRLTAQWQGQSDEVTFEATNDLDATIQAIDATLDRAWDGNPSPMQRVWNFGQVTLYAPDGTVMHVMPEKEVT